MTTDFGPSPRHPSDRPGAAAAARRRQLGPLVAALVALGPASAVAQARFADFERLPGFPPVTPPLGRTAPFVHIADVNEDGHAEIVGGFGDMFYWFNNRRGRLLPPVTPPNQPFGGNSQLAVGDVDGDGHIDVLVPRMFSYTSIPPDSLFLGDGRGGFVDVAATHLPAKLQSALCATFGDVDGDGDQDVVLGCVYPNSSRNVVYLNDGTGRFREDPSLASFPPDWDDTLAVRLADLDGDGVVDLICGNDAPRGYDTKIYLNSGTGHFLLRQAFPLVIGAKIEVGDIDGDGDLDIGLFTSGGGYFPQLGQPTLLENDGSANFTDISHRLPSHTWEFQGAAFGDIDGDGDLDIVIPRWPESVGPNLYLAAYQWINDGTGHFTDVTTATMPRFEGNYWGGYTITRLELADMDADGDLDIITDRSPFFTPPDRNRIYWNLTRQIYAAAPPRPGKSFDLEVYARSGHIVVPAVAVRPAQVPLGSLGIFGLDPATVVSGQGLVMPSSGKSVLSFTVPNNPTLIGKRVFWQALDIDPANPAAARLTNAFEETFEQ